MTETIIPDNVSRAIKEFCELLRGELGENLLGIRLFGSVVRGTATPESDIVKVNEN